MTRKVLISYGYGAGWSTWNTTYGHDKELAMDPELIRLVESRQHIGETTGGELRDRGIVDINDSRLPYRSEKFEASLAFIQRAWEVNGKHIPCLLGVDRLYVEKVDGSFLVKEYDGSEFIEYAGQEWW